MQRFVHGFLGFLAEALETFCHALRTFLDRESHVEFAGDESEITQIAEQVEFAVGDDGAFQKHHLAEIRRHFVGPHAYGTDITVETHNEFLTQRVDWRVGDLCEMLAEVCVHQLGKLGQHSQWGVFAHGIDRFLGVDGHGNHDFLYFLAGVEECFFQALGLFHFHGDFSAGGYGIEVDAVAAEPVAVRKLVGQLLLDFFIVVDFTFLHVHDHHLAGTQTSFLLDFGCFEGEHAGLGGDDHSVVVGDKVAGRTQTVAVEHAAGVAAVGKQQGCRTVPCLHED